MLNESHTEQSLISILQAQGYEYFYWPDIAPYSSNPQRESFESVILEKELIASLARLNPNIPLSAQTEALQHILNLGTNEMMTNNEKFHSYLTDGVPVEYFKDGQTKGINVQIIDTDHIENNHFWVVNQLVIKENNNEKRLDVVVYVNGLPLVLIELKNPTDEEATIDTAFQQIQNYKTAVPSIFYYNALCVISDGLDARVSTLSAPFSRYLAWKSPNKKENWVIPELQILAEKMLKKDVLLTLIKYNTVFEAEETKDQKTGLVSIVKQKKVAAYHQYYAVEKAVNETIRACESLPQMREMPEGQREYGDRKVWVIWHTQGSGKSLSMVFYAGQIVVHPEMKNPTLVILTDRNDLDEQLFTTFGNCISLLRQKPVQAQSREQLKELLKVAGGGIIFTTIQKFHPSEGNVYEALTERTNIVVVADEAHRSQYGFAGKEVTTDEGSEIRYGNAKYLRDALPNASFIGFTGTPIEKEDRDTQKVFGGYIDVYDIAQAVRDGATVPINYESRLVKIKMNADVSNKIDVLVDEITDATEEQKEKAKKRNTQIDAIVGNPERIADIANDIVTHFEAREKSFEGKAMIVCMTRQIAVNLFEQIIQLRPEWQSSDSNKWVIKVVMTSSSDDPASFQPHSTTKEERKKLALRLKDPKDELKLVIVRDMWLTGFDAPCLHTMYIDKKMQGASLMQAIARVNRVYKDKPGWLIVDYIGIGQDLRNAMAIYTESGWEWQAVVDIGEAIAGMKEKFEVVEQMFYGFEYKAYFTVSPTQKLQILLWAQNFILQNEELKTRFLKETTTLSKLFALSIPSDAAIEIKDEIAFFQAIKSRINKFTPSGQKTNTEVETAIKQIVDEALTSWGIVNIFEAAGIQAPSLEILSEEFLLEVKNMQHKNLAFELLKKILNDEVKIRKQKSIVQGKKFSEMLQDVIKRYHNNQIDTAKVIEELSEIARDMRIEDHKAEELWLTSQEYAFYMILAENTSTKFLEEHKMKELIHMIVDIIRKNATVDWEKREDVRAKLRLTVRKVLMRYGYPPDLARLEADRVLEQSELLAGEINRD
jgi:type I restriction enzyme, R subunit